MSTLKLCRKHIIGNNHKILIITDLHLKSTNPTNRYNYPQEVLDYVKYIVKLVEHEHIDIVIFLGDIYNDEFVGKQSASIGDKLIGMINHMKRKGVRVYTLMGNHEKHKFAKGCPFFNHIDYDSARIMRDLERLEMVFPEFPVPTFETCDELVIGNQLCIHMHHFSDIDKSYLSPKTDLPCNLGLFHDAILPSKARQHIKALTEVDLGQYSKVEYNDEMFANLNYAVCGDIHVRIGEIVVTTSTGECLSDIPGTLGRNDSSIAQSHESVELPLFTVTDSGVTKSHIHFKLLPYNQSFKISIIEENKQRYADMKDLKANLESTTTRMSFNEAIQQFPDYAQNIVNEILQNGNYELKTLSKVAEFIKKGRSQ